MPGIRELAVQPFRGTATIAGSVRDKRNHLADLALQQENQAIRNRQLDQRDTQLDQGQTRLDQAAKQANMNSEEFAAELLRDVVSETGSAEETLQYMNLLASQGAIPPVQPKLEEALRKLPPEVFGTARQQNTPSGVQEFNAITEGCSDEELARARRVKARIIPPAVGNANTTIASGNAGVTAEQVADVAGTVAGGKKAGEQAIEASGDARKQLSTIKSNIAKYDEAIQLLEDGAQTGAVVSSLPSVQAASVQLDNVQRQLGLNVIEQVTFGALSERELQLALATALPTNLQPQELKKWLIQKKAAQEKLAKELESAAIFLGTPGNTVAEYMQLMQSAREVDAAVPQGVKSGRFTVRQK